MQEDAKILPVYTKLAADLLAIALIEEREFDGTFTESLARRLSGGFYASPPSRLPNGYSEVRRQR